LASLHSNAFLRFGIVSVIVTDEPRTFAPYQPCGAESTEIMTTTTKGSSKLKSDEVKHTSQLSRSNHQELAQKHQAFLYAYGELRKLVTPEWVAASIEEEEFLASVLPDDDGQHEGVGGYCEYPYMEYEPTKEVVDGWSEARKARETKKAIRQTNKIADILAKNKADLDEHLRRIAEVKGGNLEEMRSIVFEGLPSAQEIAF
jgi:hypothetical protein